MKDDRETASWGERAVNRAVRLVISRLVEAECVDVRVKTTLPKAMRGEVDAISIDLQEFSVRQNLQIATFQLQIDQVAVVPKLAVRGTFQLLQPSTGKLTITLREKQLSDFLRAQLVEERSQLSTPPKDPSQGYRIEHINTVFQPENQLQIALDWTTISTELIYSSTLLMTPEIISEGQAVNLAVQSTLGQEVPAALMGTVLSLINEFLSLCDFNGQGIFFQIQQLEVNPKNLTLQAAATIHQIPSR